MNGGGSQDIVFVYFYFYYFFFLCLGCRISADAVSDPCRGICCLGALAGLLLYFLLAGVLHQRMNRISSSPRSSFGQLACDIRFVRWPRTPTSTDHVGTDLDGSVTVASLDGLAKLSLAAHGHSFEITFPIPIDGKAATNDFDVSGSSQGGSNSESPAVAPVQYTWVHQSWSVHCFPVRWEFPLYLALEHARVSHLTSRVSFAAGLVATTTDTSGGNSTPSDSLTILLANQHDSAVTLARREIDLFPDFFGGIERDEQEVHGHRNNPAPGHGSAVGGSRDEANKANKADARTADSLPYFFCNADVVTRLPGSISSPSSATAPGRIGKSSSRACANLAHSRANLGAIDGQDGTVLIWTPNATARWLASSNEAQIDHHEDGSVLFVSATDRLCTHVFADRSVRVHMLDSPPIAIRVAATGTRYALGPLLALAAELEAAAAQAIAARTADSCCHSPAIPVGSATDLYRSAGTCPAGRGAAAMTTNNSNNEVIEAIQVPETGLFKAFADGRVHVVFDDRTLLWMDASRTRCELVLPDATSVAVRTENPIGVAPYVEKATEFGAWVFATPSERATILHLSALADACTNGVQAQRLAAGAYLRRHTVPTKAPVAVSSHGRSELSGAANDAVSYLAQGRNRALLDKLDALLVDEQD